MTTALVLSVVALLALSAWLLIELRLTDLRLRHAEQRLEAMRAERNASKVLRVVDGGAR